MPGRLIATENQSRPLILVPNLIIADAFSMQPKTCKWFFCWSPINLVYCFYSVVVMFWQSRSS